MESKPCPTLPTLSFPTLPFAALPMPVTSPTRHAVPDQHGVNLFTSDPQLAALLQIYLPGDLLDHLLPHLEHLGELAGGVLDTLAQTADHNPPVLEHRTRAGLDVQRIVKHPAYVELERVAFSQFGLAAASHRGGILGWPKAMPPAAKYAFTYLYVQAEFGVCCPLSMTDSLTRTLCKFASPELVERFLPQLTSTDFDALYQGAMFMTEQGAGSDVAATETRAVAQAVQNPADRDGSWRLHGDKWFCSNPDADLAMVLARPEGAGGEGGGGASSQPGIKGLSLFLLPKRLADGSPNAYRIVRLKDKLGTRSMASGEIQLNGARAWLVGERGRGFVQMADMINNSRLSNGVRAAGLMRRAVSEAMFVARERQAFGKRLIDMPLMRRQLLKMMLPMEQARSMVFQTAAALHASDSGDAATHDAAYPLVRILTPLIKFRACRDARKVTGDAMEVRGGCGYIEDWSDARLLRDAHLGSIWEGTTNIVALDVLRAIQREGSLPVLRAHLETLLGQTPLHNNARAVFTRKLARVLHRANSVAALGKDGEHLARSVASSLYHLTSAIAMAWEAGQSQSARRMKLAQLVVVHRLLPQDLLAVSAADDGAMEILDAADDAAQVTVEEINLF
jgi:acyl-CoA dehydrogenase